MQIKPIFRRKVLPLASFWKGELLELENGLLSLVPKAKTSYTKESRWLGVDSQQASGVAWGVALHPNYARGGEGDWEPCWLKLTDLKKE